MGISSMLFTIAVGAFNVTWYRNLPHPLVHKRTTVQSGTAIWESIQKENRDNSYTYFSFDGRGGAAMEPREP